jgi:hypothetical protein
VLSADISILGNPKQVARAENVLKPMLARLGNLNVVQARLIVQDVIDAKTLYASILYRGHQVWGRKRIILNLKRIIVRGQLYSNNRVKWMRVNSSICLPAVPDDFKPILSQHFYHFLIMCCGSKQHYSRAGWIGIYPTLADLKRFFMKNEYGKQVSDYIPDWKSDALRVVEDIERLLYPFRSYIKAKAQEDARRHRIQ